MIAAESYWHDPAGHKGPPITAAHPHANCPVMSGPHTNTHATVNEAPVMSGPHNQPKLRDKAGLDLDSSLPSPAGGDPEAGSVGGSATLNAPTDDATAATAAAAAADTTVAGADDDGGADVCGAPSEAGGSSRHRSQTQSAAITAAATATATAGGRGPAAAKWGVGGDDGTHGSPASKQQAQPRHQPRQPRRQQRGGRAAAPAARAAPAPTTSPVFWFFT